MFRLYTLQLNIGYPCDIYMKTDKKLLEIWGNKELSFKNLNEYEKLPPKEKVRIFDLIIKGATKRK